eukprot:18416-Eustigmatos_ZCMA.PRE.1
MGSTIRFNISNRVAPRATAPSRWASGMRASPSSVATITTGSVSRARVSDAHNRPPVPKVGDGSASSKNHASSEPPMP